MATWRSGYAAVCKTVYPGSIPGVASNLFNDLAGDRLESKNYVSEKSVAQGGFDGGQIQSRAAFEKLTGDTVVWERGTRLWRKRQDYDRPGRQQ
jgi:hypothetical protein